MSFPKSSHRRLASPIVAFILAILAQPTCALADSRASIREFFAGHRSTFSTETDPRHNGLNLSIEYPASWRSEDGDRQGVVQKIFSDGGRGLEGVIISAMRAPLSAGAVVTERDQRAILSPSGLRGMLPRGARFVHSESTTVDGTPAGILEYTMHADRVGVEVTVQSWSLLFFSGEMLVWVAFTTGDFDNAGAARQMATFKSLFRSMALSIVLHNGDTPLVPLPFPRSTQRNTASNSSNANAEFAQFTEPAMGADSANEASFWTNESWMIIGVVLLSIVFTWGVGLAPPLLVRYAILRRPLSRIASSWIAAASCSVFWIGFRALDLALGELPGTGVVWLLVFFVARWIMSRGSVAKVPSDESVTERLPPIGFEQDRLRVEAEAEELRELVGVDLGDGFTDSTGLATPRNLAARD